MTQKDICEKTGIPLKTVKRIMNELKKEEEYSERLLVRLSSEALDL